MEILPNQGSEVSENGVKVANVQLEIQKTSYEEDGKIFSPNCQVMPDSAHYARCTYASIYPPCPSPTSIESFFSVSQAIHEGSLLQDSGNQASRNSTASLSDIESLALVDSYGIVDFAQHLNIVSGHCHLA